MLNFFESIIDFLKMIGDVVKSIFDTLVMLFNLVQSVVPLVIRLQLMLPTIIGLSFSVVIAVAVAKFVVGR